MLTYRQPFKGEYPITQRYGETITDPKGHTGIDYGCPEGTPILASADGIVMKAGWDSTGYGNMVNILHAKDRATLYAHLKEVNVYDNQKVKQGDVVGWSGNTGNSTGPHLHFEARTRWNDYNSHFDPMLLPLMSVDDSILPENAGGQFPSSVGEPSPLTEGIYRVACDAAYVRGWQSLSREKLVYRGEPVYVFPMVKYYDGLPFYFIGAGSCMAAYDNEGTIILEKAESG